MSNQQSTSNRKLIWGVLSLTGLIYVLVLNFITSNSESSSYNGFDPSLRPILQLVSFMIIIVALIISTFIIKIKYPSGLDFGKTLIILVIFESAQIFAFFSGYNYREMLEVEYFLIFLPIPFMLYYTFKWTTMTNSNE